MSKSEIERILTAINDIKKEIAKMYTNFSLKYANNSRDIAGNSADICDLKRNLGECKAEEDAKINTLTSFQSAEQLKESEKEGVKHFIVKHWKAILIMVVIIAIILLLIAGGVVYIMSKLPNIDRLVGEAIKNR